MRSDDFHRDLLEFEWEIPCSGYRWVSALKVGEDRGFPLYRAVEGGDPGLKEEHAIYRPVLLPTELQGTRTTISRPLLTEPGLHLTLEAVGCSESAILDFANNYGTLGLKKTTVDIGGMLNALGVERVNYHCDSLDDWCQETMALRKAFEIWGALKRNRAEKSLWEELLKLVSPRVKDIEGKPSLLADHSGMVLNVGPRNLCTAAWLQFEREVEGFFDFRRCAQCGRWFRFYPQKIRKEQIFCSQACRSKSYRARQEEARRMKAAGIPIEEIAAEMESDLETVQGWISARIAALEKRKG